MPPVGIHAYNTTSMRTTQCLYAPHNRPSRAVSSRENRTHGNREDVPRSLVIPLAPDDAIPTKVAPRDSWQVYVDCREDAALLKHILKKWMASVGHVSGLWLCSVHQEAVYSSHDLDE